MAYDFFDKNAEAFKLLGIAPEFSQKLFCLQQKSEPLRPCKRWIKLSKQIHDKLHYIDYIEWYYVNDLEWYHRYTISIYICDIIYHIYNIWYHIISYLNLYIYILNFAVPEVKASFSPRQIARSLRSGVGIGFSSAPTLLWHAAASSTCAGQPKNGANGATKKRK